MIATLRTYHGTKSEWIPIGIIQLFPRFLLCFLGKTDSNRNPFRLCFNFDRCPEKKLIKLEEIKKMIIDKNRKEKKRRGKKIKNKKQANSTL